MQLPISQLWSYLVPFSRYQRIKLKNSSFSPAHHCLTPPLRGNPSEFLDSTYTAKLVVKLRDPISLTVFDWSSRVTDGRTDRQTANGRAIAYRALCRTSLAKNHRRRSSGVTVALFGAWSDVALTHAHVTVKPAALNSRGQWRAMAWSTDDPGRCCCISDVSVV